MAHPRQSYGGRSPEGIVQEATRRVHNCKTIIRHWRVAITRDHEEAAVRVIRQRATTRWWHCEVEATDVLDTAFSRMVAAGFVPDCKMHTSGRCIFIYYWPPSGDGMAT